MPHIYNPEFLNLSFLDIMPVKMAGFIWLGLGCTFWIYSAIYFLKNFKPGEVITTGLSRFAEILSTYSGFIK